MTDTTALEQNRIEDNLERTRSRMDARLSELQERLSPGQVLDDLMTYFRGSEGAEFGRSLLDSVKSNPLPAALTGIPNPQRTKSWPRPGSVPPGARSVNSTNICAVPRRRWFVGRKTMT
jgi:hypothetical protein